MATEYTPSDIEPKWQQYWENEGLFEVDTEADADEDPYYGLAMFPYPSGEMHVGHGRNFILLDAVCRYKKMQGKTVLSPMGWDAFGLPAENAAIEKDVHPKDWTYDNIETIREQIKRWGIGYDWSREIATCHPKYYRWTQWIFQQMFQEGLAYQETEEVNWCDHCNTVLANEQVVDNACERCGTPVEQKELQQWFLKITDYAQELLDDLDTLEDWPEKVRRMQRNWIGRSEGAEITFEVPELDDEVTCFTTRPDTLYGVTFMVLAPEHPMVETLAERTDRTEEIRAFTEECRGQTMEERKSESGPKKGKFLGAHAVNPINDEEVPIWVADYALMEYGTGAVMAVPAHDQRDFEFARSHDIDVRPVVEPEGESLDGAEMEEAYEENGVQVNSGRFDGLDNTEAQTKITEALKEEGTGDFDIQYRLNDWLISRQRYWGAPIPVIHCDDCGTVPVPEEDLPVTLPDVEEFKPTGRSPLARTEEFYRTDCPECGSEARRETDTMDTFVDSSWYFLRYINPRQEDAPWTPEDVNNWLPVDQYIGGVEHAILHLLYARFITKFLRDIDWLDFDEPFESLFTQGMICRRAYRCPECRSYLWKAEVEQTGEATWEHPECGTEVDSKIMKMSKSKNNAISPDDLIEEYGTDVQRLYTLFMGPPDKEVEWDDEAITGCDRFLKRVWKLVREQADRVRDVAPDQFSEDALDDSFSEIVRKTHETVMEVTSDFEDRIHPNTAISEVMELVKTVRSTLSDTDGELSDDQKGCLHFALVRAIKLLAPFVPHLAEELWQTLGHEPSVFEEGWPAYSEEKAQASTVEIVIQVDGTVRSRMEVDPDLPEEKMQERALADETVQEYLNGADPQRVIVVPDTLVNVVT